MRETTNFNENWYFALGHDGAYECCQIDENAFRKLNLPHDWSMDYPLREEASTGGGGGYVQAGIGWYKKWFSLSKLKNQKLFLYFEGIYMNSTVYINGRCAGGQVCGSTSFYVDITNAVHEGENLVVVRVDNSNTPNSRWYSGSGIYRDVYLVKCGEVHFDHFGVRCATNGVYPERNMASLQIRSLVSNETNDYKSIGVFHRLYDKTGKLVSTSSAALCLAKGETSDCMTRPAVKDPQLWSNDAPYLYTLVSTVIVDGEEVDSHSSKIGIRTAVFDADRGFLLNENRVKIKGMCIHHDCGLFGAVGYREVWEKRLKALKDMGCNGIRCAHVPPAPVVLDLCDELGFLVMDEAFDEWLLSKNKSDNYYSESLAYGQGMLFYKHADHILTTMIRRDYNHPSVIIWSIGNEIPEQSCIDGVSILNHLQDICHREDSSRMVTCACDNLSAANESKTLPDFANALDVVGYNYVDRWGIHAETFYDEDRHMYPSRRIIGTENNSVGGIRGDYTRENPRSDYVNITMRNEALWRYTASHDFVSGDYLWTGIDYLGETCWPQRGATFGPIDTAGFKKDAYYYFRSIWNSNSVTLHLAPHWNFDGQGYRQVICYTNCDVVKLYINGRLVGSRGLQCPRKGCVHEWNDADHSYVTTNDLHLVWDVDYEPGVLKAEGYIDGKLVIEKEVKTTGKPSFLVADCSDQQALVGRPLLIEISAKDKNGNFVPNANYPVTCKIEGNAHLIGMDAGDLTDLSDYSCSMRKMFNGLLLAAVMPDKKGDIKVSFYAEDGLETEVTVSII